MKSVIYFMAVFLGACTSLKYASTVKSGSASLTKERKLASHIHPKYEKWCQKKWELVSKYVDTLAQLKAKRGANLTAYDEKSCNTEPFKEECSKLQHTIKETSDYIKLYSSDMNSEIEHFYEICPFLYIKSDLCEGNHQKQRCNGCQEIDPAKIKDPICCRAHGHEIIFLSYLAGCEWGSKSEACSKCMKLPPRK